MNPPVPSSTQFGIALPRVGLGLMWTAHARPKLLLFALPATAPCFASSGFARFAAQPVLLIAASVSPWRRGDCAASIECSTLPLPRFRAA